MTYMVAHRQLRLERYRTKRKKRLKRDHAGAEKIRARPRSRARDSRQAASQGRCSELPAPISKIVHLDLPVAPIGRAANSLGQPNGLRAMQSGDATIN